MKIRSDYLCSIFHSAFYTKHLIEEQYVNFCPNCICYRPTRLIGVCIQCKNKMFLYGFNDKCQKCFNKDVDKMNRIRNKSKRVYKRSNNNEI